MRDSTAPESLTGEGEQLHPDLSLEFRDRVTTKQTTRQETNTSKIDRLSVAYARYRWRLLPIFIYRTCFQWPRLRSKLISWKIICLLKSQIGSRVSFGKNISLWMPGGFLQIGRETTFMDRCMILVSPNPAATLRIGERCFFANDVNICAYGEIVIGNNVRIAEFTSLRDATHAYQDPNLRIDQQGDMIGTISIGDDVWIGQGCLLVAEGKSLTIGRGAVIGAHSVVKNSIPEYAVAVGAPASITRYRTESGQPKSNQNKSSSVSD